MKIINYLDATKQARIGFEIKEGKIVDYSILSQHIHLFIPRTILELIDMGEAYIKNLEDLLRSVEIKDELMIPIEGLTILAPIHKPRKNIFGIGLNYTEHVAESARSLDTSKELPQQCVIFSKPPTTVIGHLGNIKHNSKVTKQMDWEGELAVIIGKKGFRISKKEAMDYVFGYTIINDISARDCRRSGQWIVSKGQDTFAPMGPRLLSKSEIPNPHNLRIITKVNGVEKQNGNTRFMLFDIAAIIEDISSVMTLETGDIIATGTPAGVGAGRNPQEWMFPGDVVEVYVEKIGVLRNQIIDDTY